MTTEPVQRKLYFVLRLFGIKPRKNFTFSYFSMANEVFFLEDDKGQKLVLKNCLKNRSEALLNAELTLADHLRAQGCGCPEVVPAKDGRRVVEHDGDWWMMTRFIKGHTPAWGTKLKPFHFAQSIQGLARYHRAVASLDPAIDTDRIKSSDYERNLEWCLELERQLLADQSGRESVAKMRLIIGRYVELARKLPALLPPEKLARCETLMVHGDFHCFNVIFRRRRFYACYDFDFIRRDLKIMDISWSLNFVIRRFYFQLLGKAAQDREFKPSQEQRYEIYRRAFAFFVKNYRKHYRVSDLELSLLPNMQAAQALNNLRFFKLSNSEAECLDHWNWFNWLLENLDENLGSYERAMATVLGKEPA